ARVPHSDDTVPAACSQPLAVRAECQAERRKEGVWRVLALAGDIDQFLAGACTPNGSQAVAICSGDPLAVGTEGYRIGHPPLKAEPNRPGIKETECLPIPELDVVVRTCGHQAIGIIWIEGHAKHVTVGVSRERTNCPLRGHFPNRNFAVGSRGREVT